MDNLTIILVFIYGLVSLLVSIKGWKKVIKKNNPFGLTPYFFWLGIFVWGDAVFFGLFWFLAALITLLLNDGILFLLIISVFWLVRSIGETIYWLNQQFSVIKRNPPEQLKGHGFIKNDAIWFIYQIFWQGITMASTITTVYLFHTWLK